MKSGNEQIFGDVFSLLDSISAKGKEIHLEGKNPFERKEWFAVIYLWRIIGVFFAIVSFATIAIVTKIIVDLFHRWGFWGNLLLLPMIVLAIIAVLLFSGSLAYQIISKHNPPFEFAVVTRPLVLIFLAITVIVGAIVIAALAVVKH